MSEKKYIPSIYDLFCEENRNRPKPKVKILKLWTLAKQDPIKIDSLKNKRKQLKIDYIKSMHPSLSFGSYNNLTVTPNNNPNNNPNDEKNNPNDISHHKFPCSYGSQCYRKSKTHLDTYSHPDVKNDDMDDTDKIYDIDKYME